MSQEKRRTKTKRAARPKAGQAESVPDAGRIIENGLAMLIPFIIERIVLASTAPQRAPAPKVPGYFDGYQHCLDEARYVVRTECAACECALCRKLMSDGNARDPFGTVVR